MDQCRAMPIVFWGGLDELVALVPGAVLPSAQQ
jgi:hypothetical protein